MLKLMSNNNSVSTDSVLRLPGDVMLKLRSNNSSIFTNSVLRLPGDVMLKLGSSNNSGCTNYILRLPGDIRVKVLYSRSSFHSMLKLPGMLHLLSNWTSGSNTTLKGVTTNSRKVEERNSIKVTAPTLECTMSFSGFP